MSHEGYNLLCRKYALYFFDEVRGLIAVNVFVGFSKKMYNKVTWGEFSIF